MERWNSKESSHDVPHRTGRGTTQMGRRSRGQVPTRRRLHPIRMCIKFWLHTGAAATPQDGAPQAAAPQDVTSQPPTTQMENLTLGSSSESGKKNRHAKNVQLFSSGGTCRRGCCQRLLRDVKWCRPHCGCFANLLVAVSAQVSLTSRACEHPRAMCLRAAEDGGASFGRAILPMLM